VTSVRYGNGLPAPQLPGECGFRELLRLRRTSITKASVFDRAPAFGALSDGNGARAALSTTAAHCGTVTVRERTVRNSSVSASVLTITPTRYSPAAPAGTPPSAVSPGSSATGAPETLARQIAEF
jgi:hypothetical protein